jgi:hypothetical protein
MQLAVGETPMQQGHDSIFRRLGKLLHDQDDGIKHEPLPKRWVDLIHFLDEQERKTSSRSQAAAGAQLSLAEAQLAVANQEKVLDELTRTDEPSEEAASLLEDLRKKVARMVAE